MMAAGGLVLALATQPFRRANDFRRGATPDVKIVAPSDWPALGYLPRDTNIIAGVHVAGLLTDHLGKRFFEIPRPPLLDLALETVEQFARVKPDGIDHVVFGAEVSAKLPQFTFVVRTVSRYDVAEVAKGLGAKRLTHREHAVFRLPLKVGSGLLFCPDERTLVGTFRLDSLELKDLDAIPAPPRPGAEGLSAHLNSVLANRVNKKSLAWLAGDLSTAVGLSDLMALARLKTQDLQPLATAKLFGAGLFPQDGWTVSGALLAPDADSARAMQESLRSLSFRGMRTLDVSDPSPNKSNEKEAWVQVQIGADSDGMRELLLRPRTPMPK